MSNAAEPRTSRPRTAEDQAEAFRNQDQFWPVRAIRRGEAVRVLPAYSRSLGELSWDHGGLRLGVEAFMDRWRVGGLLVLKKGDIALERYSLGHGPEKLWTGFSTAKSVLATLVGAALADGQIGSLDDPCEHYDPRLAGSAYAGVTIRNLLRMCSGVAWREDPDAEGRSDIQRLGRAMKAARPGAVLELMTSLGRAHPQGAVFNYCTADSCVLATVLAAAVRMPLADYLTDRVWGPGGMEADGHWQLDTEYGLELGGFGISARLRDIGRFGLLMLEDGETADGRRILPSGWRDLASRPDCPATAYGRLEPGNPGGYGYHWWSTPPVAGVHDGLFSANGAYGQLVYINPAEEVVVIQSAWSEPHDQQAGPETVAFVRNAVQALKAD